MRKYCRYVFRGLSYVGVLIGVSLTSFSVAQTPDSVATKSVESSLGELKTWMEKVDPLEASARAAEKFPSESLNVLLENFQDPRVTQFLKSQNALVRLTYLKPGISKKIVSLGLMSPDKNVRGPAKNLLRMLTKPTEKELKDPNSYFNSVAKSYSAILKANGQRDAEPNSPKTRNAIMRAYHEDLFSGHGYSQSPSNSLNLLRARLQSAEALSQIHDRNSYSERDLLKKWFQERDSLSSTSDLVTLLAETGVSEKEISALRAKRARHLARQVICSNWTYPRPRAEGTIYFQLIKALKPSFQERSNLKSEEFREALGTVEMDRYAHSHLRLRWPYLLGQLYVNELNSGQKQAQFLEVLDTGLKLCRSHVAQGAGRDRCLTTCAETSCDVLEDIKMAVSDFTDEVVKHRKYSESLIPPEKVLADLTRRLTPLVSERERLESQIRDLESKNRSEDASRVSEMRRSLRRVEERIDSQRFSLDSDEMESCLAGVRISNPYVDDGGPAGDANSGQRN